LLVKIVVTRKSLRSLLPNWLLRDHPLSEPRSGSSFRAALMAVGESGFPARIYITAIIGSRKIAWHPALLSWFNLAGWFSSTLAPALPSLPAGVFEFCTVSSGIAVAGFRMTTSCLPHYRNLPAIIPVCKSFAGQSFNTRPRCSCDPPSNAPPRLIRNVCFSCRAHAI